MADRAAGTPQYEVAQAVEMKPDALSRAINDQRAFSSLELATLADYLGVDVHWLITGEADPRQLRYAARHSFDHATGTRDVPGLEADRRLLQDIELVYRQAGQLSQSDEIPRTPADVRTALGHDFVRSFVERLESRLGVDVVRVPDLSTSYCFAIDGRKIIAIKATGNWFYENFCLAHELAHLAAGHLNVSDGTAAAEATANAFAAELLMPRGDVLAGRFDQVSPEGFADWVWDHGVSADAAARRVAACGVQPSDAVREWSTQPTQRLLRRHWRSQPAGTDAISERMARAALRHFPRWLLAAHVERIEAGLVGPDALAWMLDVDVAELDLEAPEPPSGDVDVLARDLGLMPVP